MFAASTKSESLVSEHGTTNPAVTPPFFQPKLTVNTPGDALEREADAVADQVMRMREGDAPIVQRMPLTHVGNVQRKCAGCEEKEKEGVQRKEAGGGDASGKAAPSVVSDVLSSGRGKPMDAGTQQFMESRFGQDFSQVRIHTDARAAESASAVQARAYTSGRDLVFGKGEYQPGSAEGRRLLAHELVHVGQQAKSIQRQTAPSLPVQSTCTEASNIISTAAARTLGNIGTSYDKGETAGWWYSPNGDLGGARTQPYKWEIQQGATNPIPSPNYIVNWGDQWTCNLFVYDVLHQAGYNPPLQSNKHYYDAGQTYNLAGKLKTYFEEITDWSSVCPGDVYATGGHMEIVATAVDSEGNFEGFGGHASGASRESKQAYAGNKFFRLKQLVTSSIAPETPQSK